MIIDRERAKPPVEELDSDQSVLEDIEQAQRRMQVKAFDLYMENADQESGEVAEMQKDILE